MGLSPYIFKQNSVSLPELLYGGWRAAWFVHDGIAIP